MREIVIRRRAERHLAELAAYIALEAGPAVAHGYIDRIYALCDALAEFPERGRLRGDIAPGLRSVTMERRVTIVYRTFRSRVEIVSVAYGGRDFVSELKRAREGP